MGVCGTLHPSPALPATLSLSGSVLPTRQPLSLPVLSLFLLRVRERHHERCIEPGSECAHSFRVGSGGASRTGLGGGVRGSFCIGGCEPRFACEARRRLRGEPLAALTERQRGHVGQA